jgi:hypothetical protein
MSLTSMLFCLFVLGYLANKPEDTIWYNVALIVAQLDGMLQGYNDNCAQADVWHRVLYAYLSLSKRHFVCVFCSVWTSLRCG